MAEPIVLRGTLVTPREMISRGRVVVEGGKITEVGPDDGSHDGRVYDFGDSLVAPGLIDVHIHGGGGHDVMDASQGSIEGLSGFLAEGGVTGFLAATYTASQEATLDAVGAVRGASGRGTGGAEVLGIHLEGPYISRERRGAQQEEHIREPSIEELGEVFEAAGGLVKVVTLAPEREGALEAVRWLGARGVVPSAGHTDATFDETEEAVDAGLRHAAHLFNAMRPIHHREPGAAGAALTDGRVSVELIADGAHVHPSMLRLAATVKGAGRTVLVSDAIKPAGLPEGEYNLGDQKVIVKEGRCLLDSGVLAGSCIRLCEAVRNMAGPAGLPVTEAVEMASSSPARVLGLSDRKGRLVPGMDADITVMGWGFDVLLTMVGGRVVYRR